MGLFAGSGVGKSTLLGAIARGASADVVVVVTEWNEFRALSPARLKSLMRGKLVMDLRNVFDPAAFAQAGLDYRGIGRPSPRLP